MDRFYTSKEVRNALGSIYDLIRSFDTLPEERRKTTFEKNNLWKIGPKICAICKCEEINSIHLEAAHIISLEECGKTTIHNLLPLCRRRGRYGREAGCHILYDDGHFSAANMYERRKFWTDNNVNSIREQLQSSWDENNEKPSNIGNKKVDEVQSVLVKRHYRKAIKIIQNRLDHSELSEIEKFQYQIKIMELSRRRSAKNSLEIANKIRLDLNACKIPQELLSWFYYESGYIFKLRGEIQNAKYAFRKSISSLNDDDPNYFNKWIPAKILLIHSRVSELVLQEKYSKEWQELESSIKKAEKLALQTNEIHGMRWIFNCKLHLVSFYLAYGKMRKAENTLKDSLNYFENMTVKTGWSVAFRSTVNSIRGQFLAKKAKNDDDAKEALRYLSRSMVSLLSGNRGHPEGIRDVLFSVVICLKLLDKPKLNHNKIKKLSYVTQNIVDGSAWLYPNSSK